MKFGRKQLRRNLSAFNLFLLLQKNLDHKEIVTDKLAEEGETNFQKIRCPHCKWQPKASSKWFCSDCDFPEYFYNACGTFWNTFETGGKCPGCQHQWRWTSCLSCSKWALHDDWYVKETK